MNWLLFWLIFISLAIHVAAVFRFSPIFQSKKLQSIEIEIRSPQRNASPNIPQPPARDIQVARLHKSTLSPVKPVPIPETDIPNLDAPTPPVPSPRASTKQPEKPNVSQTKVLPWFPPEIKTPSPPVHPIAVTPQRFKASTTPVRIHPVPPPGGASPLLKAPSTASSASPSDVKPGKPQEKATRAVSWSGPKTGTAPESSGQKQSGDYFALVRARIENSKKYPLVARKRGAEGKVLVQFIIGLDGSLEGLKILKKSSYGILDRAALSAVEGASPFPKPPAEQFTSPIPLQITIVFHMR